MKEVVIQLLRCDSTCATCSGPTADDCETCSGANEVVINGECECDVDNDYYNSTSGCTQTCPGGTYKNPVQRICTSDCTDFPYLFIENGTTCV